MTRLHGLALGAALMMVGCEGEPELAVARASLYDDAPAVPSAPPRRATPSTTPAASPTPASREDPMVERLNRDITPRNALQKAKDLEATMDREIDALQARLAELGAE